MPERITGQVSKFYLFKAAEASCLRCVQQYLEWEFIEPLNVSDDGRSSTVLDFAEDAAEKIRLERQPWLNIFEVHGLVFLVERGRD